MLDSLFPYSFRFSIANEEATASVFFWLGEEPLET